MMETKIGASTTEGHGCTPTCIVARSVSISPVTDVRLTEYLYKVLQKYHFDSFRAKNNILILSVQKMLVFILTCAVYRAKCTTVYLPKPVKGMHDFNI